MLSGGCHDTGSPAIGVNRRTRCLGCHPGAVRAWRPGRTGREPGNGSASVGELAGSRTPELPDRCDDPDQTRRLGGRLLLQVQLPDTRFPRPGDALERPELVGRAGAEPWIAGPAAQ